MKVLVTGGNGQLAQEFLRSSSFEIHLLSRDELDITNIKSVRKVVESLKPDYIINTAAYNKVDQAEEDYQAALDVNYEGVKNLVELANEYNISMIHFSTDYVFDGNTSTPYTEESQTNPETKYGESKYKGESFAINNLKNGAVFRVSWVFSLHGENFVNKIMKIGIENNNVKIVNDQFGTPTWTKDIVLAVESYINKNISGVNLYNFSNEGVCSWYEYALYVRDFLGLAFEIEPVKSSDFKTKAKRPLYTVMSKNKFKEEFDYEIAHWTEAIKLAFKSKNSSLK